MVVLCYSEWLVERLSFSSELIFILSFFRFSSLSTSEMVPVAAESNSLALPFFWCGYCYRCHTYSLGSIFLSFWVTFLHECLLCGFVCRVQVAMQELQAITVRMCRLAFQLSGKVVALQLDNSTVKVFLCVQGDTVSLFLSRPNCHILILAAKHGITHISTYISTHLNMEANYL